MANEKMVFEISGPIHLAQVDWNRPDHKRTVAASLVMGVYVLESDRQLSDPQQEALAAPWWEFFHFRFLRNLVDSVDGSIFGAIFELDNRAASSVDQPIHVLALRGTITKPDTISRDLEHDLQIIRHGLHTTSRFLVIMQAVRDLVNSQQSKSTVWLAGHSLGSALGMLAGKIMAKEGALIESFFFNPPFISAPIDRIKDKNIKHGLRIAGSFLVAGLALAKKVRDGGTQTREESTFEAVAAWVPHLFVNPSDFICSEFVGYFRHREKMEELGIGHVQRISTQHSIGGLLLGSVFGDDCDPVHLIPSADLTVNMGSYPDLKSAHGIHQWFCPDLNLENSVHLY